MREGAATVAPARVALHARRVVGDDRAGVTDLPVRLHHLKHVEVGLVEENLGVLRHLAAYSAKVDKKDLAQLTEVADLLEHVDAHLSDGALAEGDAAVLAGDFFEATPQPIGVMKDPRHAAH